MIALLLSSLALADAIGPDPEGCPPGSYGTSSHEGEWCAPSVCDDARPCTEGTCTPDVALCVLTEVVHCGGAGGFAEDCKVTIESVQGPCEADGGCATGECESASRCVSKPVAQAVQAVKKVVGPNAPGSSICGCSSTSTTSGLGLLLLALAAFFGRRR